MGQSPPSVVASLTPAKLLGCYSSLAKSRLTALVVWSAVAGYAVAPAALDPQVLTCCLVGTALTSASANAFNQYDAVSVDFYLFFCFSTVPD